jgi:hypothetical protein
VLRAKRTAGQILGLLAVQQSEVLATYNGSLKHLNGELYDEIRQPGRGLLLAMRQGRAITLRRKTPFKRGLRTRPDGLKSRRLKLI